MFGWSVSFLQKCLNDSGNLNVIGGAGLVVASLNMLIQVFLDFLFGKKGVPKLGGDR